MNKLNTNTTHIKFDFQDCVGRGTQQPIGNSDSCALDFDRSDM